MHEPTESEILGAQRFLEQLRQDFQSGRIQVPVIGSFEPPSRSETDRRLENLKTLLAPFIAEEVDKALRRQPEQRLEQEAEENLSAETKPEPHRGQSSQTEIGTSTEREKPQEMADSHWFETAIRDPRLWGIISVIALAIAFSRRSANSDAAVWVFLLLAAFMGVLTINTIRVVRMSLYRTPITVIAVVFIVPLGVLAGYWLTLPVSPSSGAEYKPTLLSSPTPLAATSLSALPTAMPSLSVPSVTPLSRSTTKWLNGIVFKGGAPQRLDILMKAHGYGGPTDMEVLYVVSDDQNAAEIYLGTDTHPKPENSQRLDASDGFNFQRGEDISNVYIFSAKGGKIERGIQAALAG